MPLRNGETSSLRNERARYAVEQSARTELQQEALQAGFSSVPSFGFRRSVAELPLEIRQPTVDRTGIIDAFVNTCQRWGLTEKQQIVLLGFADNEFLGLQLLEGRWLQPSQDVRDRVGYILGISIGLGALFNENIQAEVTWLKTANPNLRDVAPLALMLGGRMAALMTVAKLVAGERELY